ncbi:MAG TPA: response regulator transcription factor [Candidatus Udaeobacter sp.]|jgi:DNA-binding NarL/FixJ family response regulator
METQPEIVGTESEVEGRSLSLFQYSESAGEEPAKIRILVLDAQPLLRQGISAYLNSQPDMMVCGEAGSVADARRTIAECQPQFVVTALRLGAGDSLKLIKELKTHNPRLCVLVYSAFEENIFAERAIRAGASGYVMKQAPSEKLATAVREIMKGGIYVSRELALSAFRKSLQRHRKDNHTPRSGACLEQLSNREMHIFQLLGSGLGTKQIAASLDLSVKTIESHRENIKHKLRLRSSGEVRERATKWVEQNLSREDHIFRAGRPSTKATTRRASYDGNIKDC